MFSELNKESRFSFASESPFPSVVLQIKLNIWNWFRKLNWFRRSYKHSMY